MTIARRDLSHLIAPVVLLAAARALGGFGPVALRLGCAWIALLAAPALILSSPARRARGAFDAIAVGAVESIALFSLLALVVHAAGGGLAALLVAHPFVVVAAGVARAWWAARGGPNAEHSGAASASAGAAPTFVLLPMRQLALLGILFVFVAIVRARPTDYRMDVYDHVGVAARVAARDRIFSREMGNGDEGPHLDPRKGTWNTLLAGVLRVSHADPMAMWDSATVLATLVGALALARLAREVLGGAWPVGWIALLLAQEGGPHRGWFAPSAYPGALGLFLYAAFLAESLAALRGRRGVPLLLLIALPLVHLMAGLLAVIAGGVLIGVIWFDRARATLPSSRPFVARLAGALAVTAAFGAWRVHAAGPLSNPMQTELQGVLFLPGGLFMLEPRTLFERLGTDGVIGLVACPFLIAAARRDIGIRWFVVMATLFVVMVSPALVPILAPKLGYLMRRLPAIAPLPLLFAVLGVEWARAAFRAVGARRRALAAGALALAILPAVRTGETAAIAMRPRGAGARVARTEAVWSSDLTAIASATPAGARVASDPITSYALYARSLARPLVLADQHAPPNDAEAPEWFRDLARILSPWTSARERDDLIARRGVTHVLVNEGIAAPANTFGLPVSPENLTLVRAAIEADTARFAAAASSGMLRLYAIRGGSVDATANPDAAAGAPPHNPFLADSARPEDAVVTRCGIGVAAPRVDWRRVASDDVVWIDCSLFAARAPLPIGDYSAFVAMTRVVGGDGPPNAQAATIAPGFHPASSKLGRGFGRLLGRAPDRFVFERSLADGRYPVILWRASETIADRFAIRVPPAAPPGRYLVTMNVVRVPVFQNRTLRGLLTDDDEYATIPVGAIEVVALGHER